MRRSFVWVPSLCVALGCSSSPKSSSSSSSGAAGSLAAGGTGATASGTTHASSSGGVHSTGASGAATTSGSAAANTGSGTGHPTAAGTSSGNGPAAAGTSSGNGPAAAGTSSSGSGPAAASSSSGSGTLGYAIFQSGSFASGWTDANWGTACPGSSSTASIGGETALAIDLSCGAFNGNFLINWNTTQELSTYGTLAFDLYLAQTSDLANLQINLQEGSNTSSANAVPLTNYVSSPTAGAFNHVVIPIGPLLDSGTSAYLGFIFHYTTSTGSTVYLNNVILSGGTGTGTAGTGSSGGAGGATTGSTGTPGAVTFTVDLSGGPARVFNPPSGPTPVSPYVYGVNSFAAWQMTTQWGMLRWGGDSFTDWNWTNNYSNSAADYCFWQGNEGGGTTLAGAVATGSPSIPADQAKGIASLVTVPILDWVSAAVSNNVYGNPAGQGAAGPCPTNNCNGDSSTQVNSGNLALPTENANTTAFSTNHASKGSTLCTCGPGASGCSGCSVDSAGAVYQDEFANYIGSTFGSGGAPVFLMLDNEPNYWPSTHPEVWGDTGGGSIGFNPTGSVSFDDIVSRNVTYATAVKAAWPAAKVFGPVVAQDGIIYAGDYADSHLPTPFGQYYLAQMAAASVSAGVSLIDAFDVHYYTDGNASGAQCLQTPRLFWDPNFTAFSPATVDAIDFGWSDKNNYFDSSLYPRQMIPRLEGWISGAYQGTGATAPGLSISEYDMGCEDQIEGGVAQANLLGVFGREGLFGATMWPLNTVANNASLVNYPVAAFDLYRNYDGQGTTVGDTAVSATTSDVDNTSVYAFTHSNTSADVDLVAINKSSRATTATITIANAPALSTATPFNLVNGTIGVTPASGSATVSCASGSCMVSYTMPPLSATTLILQ